MFERLFGGKGEKPQDPRDLPADEIWQGGKEEPQEKLVGTLQEDGTYGVPDHPDHPDALDVSELSPKEQRIANLEKLRDADLELLEARYKKGEIEIEEKAMKEIRIHDRFKTERRKELD